MIYLLITMSPLAPLAFRPAAIAHAVTGECAGDCSLCNCSPERSASHTCCCWQKKQKHERDQELEQLPDCCRQMERDTTPTLTCGSPCGDKHSPLFSGTERFEQLPFTYNNSLPTLNEETIASPEQNRPADHHDDPPDHPPKPMIIS